VVRDLDPVLDRCDGCQRNVASVKVPLPRSSAELHTLALKDSIVSDNIANVGRGIYNCFWKRYPATSRTLLAGTLIPGDTIVRGNTPDNNLPAEGAQTAVARGTGGVPCTRLPAREGRPRAVLGVLPEPPAPGEARRPGLGQHVERELDQVVMDVGRECSSTHRSSRPALSGCLEAPDDFASELSGLESITSASPSSRSTCGLWRPVAWPVRQRPALRPHRWRHLERKKLTLAVIRVHIVTDSRDFTVRGVREVSDFPEGRAG